MDIKPWWKGVHRIDLSQDVDTVKMVIILPVS
jgi:hypothetical protein